MENEKETRITYGDTANENFYLSVHKKGTTFINLHNVVKVEQEEDKETIHITTTDEDGKRTYICLFKGDKFSSYSNTKQHTPPAQ